MASHNFFNFLFTLAFFGELWHNLQGGNPASTQIILILGLIAWFDIQQPWHIVLFVSMSYFPSIASSMVKDWPIWWGGGNLSITIVDPSFDRTSHWSHCHFVSPLVRMLLTWGSIQSTSSQSEPIPDVFLFMLVFRFYMRTWSWWRW